MNARHPLIRIREGVMAVFFSFRLKRILALLLAALLIVLSLFLIFRRHRGAACAGAAAVKSVLVIDPGHGGIDGGAVAADGTRESGVNLAIAQKMAAVAGLYGQEVVMTRSSEESDVSLADYSEHDSLVRRAELANDTPGGVLISVHQNNYPTAEPTGAEVLYAATDGSRALGLAAQKNLLDFADPENRRVAAPAPEKLLLTSSVTCPAILAECGFLSNPGEAAKLVSDDYQLKLACALTAAYLQYAGGRLALPE